MYDPLERAKSLGDIAYQGARRKYYRFRPAKWYGGIVTGDVLVCNLLCHFCWVGDKIRHHPEDMGKYYGPEEAFEKLCAIAKKCGYKQMRLSGQEPTIGREHLLELIALIDNAGFSFILETNGILIGADKEYAHKLSRFKHIHVRVSLKGANKEEFHKLTGAKLEAFELQLSALKNLLDSKVSCHPAVMVSFSTQKNLEKLNKRLELINPSLPESIEHEELILYPHIIKRLKRLNLDYNVGHEPGKVPESLV